MPVLSSRAHGICTRATLPRATVIDPTPSQADILLDIGCDHQVVCYCAMLDYEYTKITPKSAEDEKLYACVIGPRELSLNELKAEALALFARFASRETAVKELAAKLGWIDR
jgi:hypothetical protein